MEQIPKSTKLKILSLFLISNILVYLLIGTQNEKRAIPNDQGMTRQDYVEVVLKGKLFTSFSELKEISLISSDNKIIIPFAVLLEQNGQELSSYESMDEISHTTSYSIYLHKKYLNPNILQKQFKIFPFGTKLKVAQKTKQRRNYEIHY